ncbi:hypothetical protein ACI2L1_42290 [Streptomyces sp. NPDC019531]|uniref:hypothetical protein n=1 Tax=Streptomyces sp. NPDC019531 TaxID=3365062 RepID=UPI00384FA848
MLTYTYEFRDETAPLRPYELVPAAFSLATQHSAELPCLWGSNSAKPLTARQRGLSGEMIAYWARFAKTGALAPRGLPSGAPVRRGHAPPGRLRHRWLTDRP